jgi:hypothetical protein
MASGKVLVGICGIRFITSTTPTLPMPFTSAWGGPFHDEISPAPRHFASTNAEIDSNAMPKVI